MNNSMNPFPETLDKHGVDFSRRSISTIQINLGKLCNQACLHCHVDAGPGRTEVMDRRTVEKLLELIRGTTDVRTVDLTGGAPEMNPSFRYIVEELTAMGINIIDRCNLTILLEPGMEGMSEFLAKHGIEIYSSLPCYLQENVDGQRGKGVYDKSITALKKLNDLGYGQPDTGLILNLVYNPGGAVLPPDQHQLKQDYQLRLKADWNITFNDLFTITNMPIKRFRHFLERENQYDEYMELLYTHFNPIAAGNVMCRDMLSIDWQGNIFDCDFNQMLEIPVGNQSTSLWQIDAFSDLQTFAIACDSHCFGCTAGAGSSCGGQVASSNTENNQLISEIQSYQMGTNE